MPDETPQTTVATTTPAFPSPESQAEGTSGSEQFQHPEAFQDRPYLQDVKDINGVYDLLDHSQKLIGKRHTPGPDSSDEEWATFYNSIGRPNTPEEYELKSPGESEADQAFLKGTKELMHAVGLTPKQAKALQEGYDKLVESTIGGASKTQEEMAQEFDTLATENFGARKDEAVVNAKHLLHKFAPEAFKSEIDGLDNQTMVVLASVLDKVYTTLVKEDGRLPGSEGSGRTPQDVRDEAKKLMQSDEFRNSRNPRYEETKAKVRELYQLETQLRAKKT